LRTAQGLKKSYDGFVEKIKEREQLGDLELALKTIFESYSKLIIAGRIHLFQDTCRWLALTDTVMNSRGNLMFMGPCIILIVE